MVSYQDVIQALKNTDISTQKQSIVPPNLGFFEINVISKFFRMAFNMTT